MSIGCFSQAILELTVETSMPVGTKQSETFYQTDGARVVDYGRLR